MSEKQFDLDLVGKITDVSIIVPVFNEVETVSMLYNKIKEALKNEGLTYEIIFIDDGSSDGSTNEILKIAKYDKRIKLIKFRRNFGKAAALSAGFNHAKGSTVITMDADLQDDPNEISNFINKIGQGYDVVSGWKKVRHDPLSKTLPSKLFNKTISLLSGVKLHDFNCGFKAYRKEVVKNIEIYGDLHRYIPAIAYSKGYKVTEIIVKHHPREYGKSKYGIERFTRGLFDCITVIFLSKYLSRPLHFFGKFGLFSGFIGFVICLYLTILKLLGNRIGDRPLLNLGILLIIIGTQFIMTGLIAELIINTQMNFSRRTYEIEDIEMEVSNG